MGSWVVGVPLKMARAAWRCVVVHHNYAVHGLRVSGPPGASSGSQITSKASRGPVPLVGWESEARHRRRLHPDASLEASLFLTTAGNVTAARHVETPSGAETMVYRRLSGGAGYVVGRIPGPGDRACRARKVPFRSLHGQYWGCSCSWNSAGYYAGHLFSRSRVRVQSHVAGVTLE